MKHGGRPGSRLFTLVLSIALLLPAGGCGEEAERIRDDVVETAEDTWCVVKDEVSGAWQCVRSTTKEGMVVLGRLAEEGAETASATVEAVFVWSRDTAGDGWAWIRAQGAGAATWAEDRTSDVWMVTKDAANDAYLWVRTEAEGGLAWVRVGLPAAWRLTKDAAGDVLVWVGERKFTAVAVVTIVTYVIAALFAAEIATVRAIAHATAVGASSVGGHFLSSLYQKRIRELDSVTLDDFLAIGESIVVDLAADVGGFRQAVVGTE